MKRYNCTLSDKRGAFGLCMEEHKEGMFVPFSEVGPLNQRVNQLLEQRNATGIAISNAILSGVVPDKHPLRSRLELLANHHKREQELLAALEEARTGLVWYQETYPETANGCDEEAMARIDAALDGKLPDPAVTITETIRTAPERIWLQVGDQAHYHSEQFPTDTSEVSWFADSVVACEVPYVRADLAGKLSDHAEQPLAMVSEGGEPCATEPPSSSQD